MYQIDRNIDEKVYLKIEEKTTYKVECDVCSGTGLVTLSDNKEYKCPKCNGKKKIDKEKKKISNEEVILTAIQIGRNGIIYNGITVKERDQRRFREEDIMEI